MSPQCMASRFRFAHWILPAPTTRYWGSQWGQMALSFFGYAASSSPLQTTLPSEQLRRTFQPLADRKSKTASLDGLFSCFKPGSDNCCISIFTALPDPHAASYVPGGKRRRLRRSRCKRWKVDARQLASALNDCAPTFASRNVGEQWETSQTLSSKTSAPKPSLKYHDLVSRPLPENPNSKPPSGKLYTQNPKPHDPDLKSDNATGNLEPQPLIVLS